MGTVDDQRFGASKYATARGTTLCPAGYETVNSVVKNSSSRNQRPKWMPKPTPTVTITISCCCGVSTTHKGANNGFGFEVAYSEFLRVHPDEDQDDVEDLSPPRQLRRVEESVEESVEDFVEDPVENPVEKPLAELNLEGIDWENLDLEGIDWEDLDFGVVDWTNPAIGFP